MFYWTILLFALAAFSSQTPQPYLEYSCEVGTLVTKGTERYCLKNYLPNLKCPTGWKIVLTPTRQQFCTIIQDPVNGRCKEGHNLTSTVEKGKIKPVCIGYHRPALSAYTCTRNSNDVLEPESLLCLTKDYKVKQEWKCKNYLLVKVVDGKRICEKWF